MRRHLPSDEASLFKTINDRGDPRVRAVQAPGQLAHEQGLAGRQMLQGVRLYWGDREFGSTQLKVMLNIAVEIEQRGDDRLGQAVGLRCHHCAKST